MNDSTREILILLFQTLRKQQEMLVQLASATRALVKALEETDDDVALRYGRYNQVARRALELQPKSELIELEQAITRLEPAERPEVLAVAAESN
jgi:hypothetical protein